MTVSPENLADRGWVGNGRFRQPLVALTLSLVLGVLLILPTGENPLVVYARWFVAGFSCRGWGSQCAILTALQYATPLLLSGLAAMVAFRVGLFSIGQFGQMIMGAGVATFLAGSLDWPPGVRGLTAVFLGMAAGGLWSAIPGFLRAYLGIHEVITTIILNPLAAAAVGPFSWQRIPPEMQLTPLVPTTKLTASLFIALLVAGWVYLYLWRTSGGFALRMSGQAQSVARYAGMHPRRAIVWGMALSGALAGLAGALEVFGVHYRFVANFSSIDQFDGIIVALMGQLHPLGIALSALLLGGLRLGTLTGLQLETAVPRELGSAIIALTMLFLAMPRLLFWLRAKAS
ncbi:MAG: ABC transporter permease [Anaerolineaceae bacterium]|nr:ABC transporter permease [Anaerolineaceae bacterium]